MESLSQGSQGPDPQGRILWWKYPVVPYPILPCAAITLRNRPSWGFSRGGPATVEQSRMTPMGGLAESRGIPLDRSGRLRHFLKSHTPGQKMVCYRHRQACLCTSGRLGYTSLFAAGVSVDDTGGDGPQTRTHWTGPDTFRRPRGQVPRCTRVETIVWRVGAGIPSPLQSSTWCWHDIRAARGEQSRWPLMRSTRPSPSRPVLFCAVSTCVQL